MTKQTRTQLLYTLLGLFIVASMTYYVMGTIAEYERIVHITQHPRPPFESGEDRVTVRTVNDEAKAAGLLPGDVLLALNGEHFRGNDQWISLLAGGKDALHVDDTLGVTIRRGTVTHELNIHLAQRTRPKTAILLSATVVQLLPPFICLLIGYWVAWARPHDWNAWLILILMTFVEVLFDSPTWWPGGWLVFLGTWYNTFQAMGTVALLLFGINFPERWRLDVKWPWLKWLIIAPILLFMPFELWTDWA